MHQKVLRREGREQVHAGAVLLHAAESLIEFRRRERCGEQNRCAAAAQHRSRACGSVCAVKRDLPRGLAALKQQAAGFVVACGLIDPARQFQPELRAQRGVALGALLQSAQNRFAALGQLRAGIFLCTRDFTLFRGGFHCPAQRPQGEIKFPLARGLRDRAPRPVDQLSGQTSGVHLPRTVGKVVRLVNQQHLSLLAAGSIALQAHPRVEKIVVIAHDHVAFQRKVEREFKRAEFVFVCQRAQGFAVEATRQRFGCGQRLRQAVIIPDLPGTGSRAAEGSIVNTDLFSCVECDGAQRAVRQQPKRVECCPAGCRPRREVKDALHKALADALERGKQRGQRLARAGGRLRQQHLLVPDGAENLRRQLPLSRAVLREGESQRLHLQSDFRAVRRQLVQMCKIGADIAVKPLGQHRVRQAAGKAHYFAAGKV